jgi:hypothetical protein
MAVTIPFTFHAFAEPEPGPRWRALFDAAWPVYQRWYLKEGDAARPSYVTARRMLRTHMPELVETYDRLATRPCWCATTTTRRRASKASCRRPPGAGTA